jgi:hypothetical protein
MWRVNWLYATDESKNESAAGDDENATDPN